MPSGGPHSRFRAGPRRTGCPHRLSSSAGPAPTLLSWPSGRGSPTSLRPADAGLLDDAQHAAPETLHGLRQQPALLLQRRRAEPEGRLDPEDVAVPRAVEDGVLFDLASDGQRADDEPRVLEASRTVDGLPDDLSRPGGP